MVSIGKIVSVDQAVRYLLEAITDAQIDYYAGRGEAPGQWSGAGAKALGLAGEVNAEALRAVMEGRDPASGEDLGRRWASKKVVAFDMTFSCPKSVSLLYALGDEEIREVVIRAHSAAVTAACEYMQEHAGWGRRYNRETQKVEPVRAQMIMPRFVHRTARPVTDPVTGVTTIDPQLHTHIPISTWALRDNGTWGQLYSEPLYAHAAAAGAVGQAVLRDELVRELGVEVTVEENGCFELSGITEDQRREFSRRTRQIEALEEARDVDSLRGHKIAVTGSRESKREVEPNHDLFEEWHQRADAVGLTDMAVARLVGRVPGALGERTLDVVGPELVGIAGLTRQAATFGRRDLVRAVAAHAPLGMVRPQLEAIVDAILGAPEMVVPLESERLGATCAAAEPLRQWVNRGMERRYSTPEMVEVERRMLDTAAAGKGTGLGQATAATVERVIGDRPDLTDGQKEMIETVCRSGDAVVLVEGAAGVGKTYALDACREALEETGHVVVGCALAGRAAQGLKEEAAISSFTLASTLRHLREHQLVENAVVVVDEAGMVGSRQIAELVEVAARDRAKLVLVGDPVQLQPIDGGAGFRALGEQLGRVVVTENVRQSELWERDALTILRGGRAPEAVSQYLEHERVRLAKNAWERRMQMIADYTTAIEEGLDAVMLARTREDAASLNQLARAAAGLQGRLAGPTLEVGDREYQVGDRVVCLENWHRARVTNGLRGEVVDVDVEHGTLRMRTAKGREVVLDTTVYTALDHGYAVTGHKAQGLTADVGLVMGSEGGSKEWVYTALSRGKMRTHYYAIDHEPIRDLEGITHWPAEDRKLERRLEVTWGRSAAKDSTLDYPGAQPEDELALHTVDFSQPGPATPAQREVIAALAGTSLSDEATWIQASAEIDRMGGRVPGSTATAWLVEAGLTPEDAAALVLDQLGRGHTQEKVSSEELLAGALVSFLEAHAELPAIEDVEGAELPDPVDSEIELDDDDGIDLCP